jgi:hypothetical protein
MGSRRGAGFCRHGAAWVCPAQNAKKPAPRERHRLFFEKRPLKKRRDIAVTARFYCAAGNPWIFIPGLMPFEENQPLLISNAYTPLFFGQ